MDIGELKSANGINLTMLCDFYELTMGNGYLEAGMENTVSYFDVFFRSVPDNGGFAIMAGLEQIIDYVTKLHFTREDIEYLRSRELFDGRFLDYLSNFRFTGDIWAIPEGTPIFPGEPVITVRAPAIQAQLLETYFLLEFNHQSLIATKANRICRAAEGRAVMEFGSRRAHGITAAVTGARAAYIAGCCGTACTVSDEIYGVKALGTMAHSWVQMFDSEREAFLAYCRTYPHNAVLLIDTYDVLRSGLPNAIKAFDEVLKPLGIKKCGVRIDSGDMAYLTKKVREALDKAGWTECAITVSNSLDEYLIAELIRQGARIDSFGVGERLITSRSHSVFGGVYKLCAVEKNGELIPKIKISENTEKITNPGFKRVYRLFNRDTGMAEADYITLAHESVDDTKPLELCDSDARWKRKVFDNFEAVELQKCIFRNGELVYELPELEEIRRYCAYQVSTLWPEVKRFANPHSYYVDLSEELMKLKDGMLEKKSGARS
ncbi:MAG: nicotinate phosphoribosyltransferase [Eubacteriales bacterium]|nr:nicotinate phosphoribosyltransferase [Eubacteriales bacterium]